MSDASPPPPSTNPCVQNDRLPPNVSLSHGALVEPLAVALHGRRRASLAPGSTVLVLGAGAVGLLCAFASRAAGARAVVVADIQADRVRFAVDHGFADAGVTVPLSSARRPGAETIEEKLAYARGLAETVKAAEVPGPEGDGDGDGDGVGAGEKRGKKKKKKKVPVGEVSATFECTGVESCMQTAIYVSWSTVLPFPSFPCPFSVLSLSTFGGCQFAISRVG